MKNKKQLTLISIIVLIIASLFFCDKNVLAIEYGALGGKPANPNPSIENSSAWFIYNLNPGESREDAVRVMNLYTEPVKTLIYAADTTKSSSGGFALEQYSEKKDGVGSWIRFYEKEIPEYFKSVFEKKENKIIDTCALSEEEVAKELEIRSLDEGKMEELKTWCEGTDKVELEMQDSAEIDIPFTITIPSDADVGEHTGGILIQKIGEEDSVDSSGTSVKLTTRVGVRIYQTVPGEIVKKLSIFDFKILKNFKEFSFDDWFGDPKKTQEYLIQNTIKNDGNVSIDHQNIVHIKDLIFKKWSKEIEDRNFQVLSRDSFISNYSWNNPRFGFFSISTEIKYKNSIGEQVVEKSDEIKLWIIPYRELAILGVIALIAFGIWYLLRFIRNKKYGGKGWKEYAIREGDDLSGLVKRYGVDWKVFVRTNKLKAPYTLEKGQKILVPSNRASENSKATGQIKKKKKVKIS